MKKSRGMRHSSSDEMRVFDVYNAPTTHKDHHQQAVVDAQHLSVHDLLSISARLKTVFNCMFHNKTPKVFCSTFGVHYNVYATFFFGLTLALMLRIVWRT